MDPSARERELKEALAVYVGSLAVDARVVLLGDASLGIADRLLEAGARVVYVWDPDPERARAAADRAPRGVYVEPYPPREPAVRPAELVLVPDLGIFDDPSDAVARSRAAAGESGTAVIRALNRETAAQRAARAFDYYDLFELVAGSFSAVRMVAELAFDGVALVVLGEEVEDGPAVSVDTQLADGDRPVAAFVAVAGPREVGVDPYAIVELRRAAGDGAVSAAALAQSQAAAEDLESRLERRSARCAELESELALRVAEARDLSARCAELESDLAPRAAEARDLALRADRAESRAGELEREIASSDEARAVEVLRLEAALRERAQAFRSLEAELARRDEIVRELVSSHADGIAVSSPRPGPAADVAPASDEPRENPAPPPENPTLRDENARLRRQLDALAVDLARREADAHASGWTVTELERRLAELERQSAPVSPGAALSQALDEVDVLRRALAQEHEARVRVESGAALAQARADIERLTVLLEQQAAREWGGSGPRSVLSDPARSSP